MLKNISNLGTTLKKEELKTINGSYAFDDVCKNLCAGLGSGQGYWEFETNCNCGF